jgi:hypothetical protein
MRPAVAALACFLAAPLFADDGNTVLLADLGDHAMQQDASPAGATSYLVQQFHAGFTRGLAKSHIQGCQRQFGSKRQV